MREITHPSRHVRVHAACDRCGDVEVADHKVTLAFTAHAQPAYSFDCPNCRRRQRVPASPLAVRLLLGCRARVLTAHEALVDPEWADPARWEQTWTDLTSEVVDGYALFSRPDQDQAWQAWMAAWLRSMTEGDAR